MEANKLSLINKKILITGGAGFIGSHLLEQLYRENQVTLLDNGRRNAIKYISQSLQSSTEIIQADIRDFNAVKKALNGKDIILHLAAIAGASFYEKDPLLTMEVNLFGTNNVLKAALETSVKHVILFSSSEVYGSLAKNVSELDDTRIGSLYLGRWSYAISKLASDHLAMAYFKKNQLPISIVRPFNVYGPRQVGEGAIVNMTKSAKDENTITIKGNGQQKRSWCYISDFIDCLMRIMQKEKIGECYNIGNPQEYYTIKHLAGEIKKYFPSAKIISGQKSSTEVLDRKPNIEKAIKELGFKPKVTLHEGLKQTVEWLKSANL